MNRFERTKKSENEMEKRMSRNFPYFLYLCTSNVEIEISVRDTNINRIVSGHHVADFRMRNTQKSDSTLMRNGRTTEYSNKNHYHFIIITIIISQIEFLGST